MHDILRARKLSGLWCRTGSLWTAGTMVALLECSVWHVLRVAQRLPCIVLWPETQCRPTTAHQGPRNSRNCADYLANVLWRNWNLSYLLERWWPLSSVLHNVWSTSITCRRAKTSKAYFAILFSCIDAKLHKARPSDKAKMLFYHDNAADHTSALATGSLV